MAHRFSRRFWNNLDSSWNHAKSRCTFSSLTVRNIRRTTSSSRPVEHPHIVLIPACTAELLRRSKPAPAVLQFIAKGDGQLIVGPLDSPRGDQRVAVPAQTGHGLPASVVGRGHFTTVRQQLELRLD